MYPSRSRMAASASLSLDEGIRTVSCMATLALRIRVSMSAMGSVMVMCRSAPSPTGLRHAGNLAGVNQLAQADAAQPELPEHRVGPATAPAPGVRPDLELGLPLLLLDQGLLRHYACCPSLRNGKPN